MPENPGAPEIGTSAVPEAPGDGQGFDYERGYSELRPAYTQATQRLSEYEGLFAALHNPDPAIQAEAAEYLGLQFAEETGAPESPAKPADEDWTDPLEEEVRELRGIVAELRDRSELEASAAAEAETIDLRDDYIGQALDMLEGQRSRKFTEAEEEILGNLAISMADQDDVPDVQGAYERLYGEGGLIETQRAGWIESKSGASQPPLGTTIPADKKPQTAEDRVNYVDERWRQLQDQQ